MKIITDSEIVSLGISPATCVEWVRESLLIKDRCQLPHKIPVHPRGTDFITTMPCLLPSEYRSFGVKVVSRTEGRKPALRSSLTMYDTVSGEVAALMDSNWITDMRTGAMAALAIATLQKSDASVYAFMGLGHIARATMLCLASVTENRHITVRLLRYKDQAEKFASEFSGFSHISFEIADDIDGLISGADVLVSAITDAKGLIVEDSDKFAPGMLLVPVHTRGFQNCDTVFDKIFGDDYAHISGFKYFNQFKSFTEIGDVLAGKAKGRENYCQRIIAYNYGLALHDVYFAYKILEML